MPTPREILILNFLVEQKTPGEVPLDQFLARALRALRTQLGMEAAFISQKADAGQPVVIHADSSDDALASGDDGAAAQERLSVPIQLGDGTPYAWLICAGRRPHDAFNERDMTLMRVYAEMIAEHIEAAASAGVRSEEVAASIRSVIRGGEVSCVYQPIVDINRGKIIAVEALARFSTEPLRSPDAWFADAARVGLEIELEHKVIEQALSSFSELPSSISVACNVTSNILLQGRLDKAFAGIDPGRIVLEINEHMSIRQYDEIARVLGPLREEGLRIAVDDAGRGIEGFRHILNLRPNIIKLDRALVQQIDTDPARRALVGAVVQFGRGQRCDLIAQGVETAAELATLKALGVSRMQGYFLRRPGPLANIVELCKRQQRAASSEPTL
jgi:EAL domain-containing protein (putative c-di-GMP-specific phosphodiesterase class I)